MRDHLGFGSETLNLFNEQSILCRLRINRHLVFFKGNLVQKNPLVDDRVTMELVGDALCLCKWRCFTSERIHPISVNKACK